MIKLIVFAAVVSVALGAFTGDLKLAETKHSDYDASPDGTYHFSYETENGISVAEDGDSNHSVDGSYQFESPEGQTIHVEYSADENGYHAEGDVIPTPPPVPALIQKGLDYIAAHPELQTTTPKSN